MTRRRRPDYIPWPPGQPLPLTPDYIRLTAEWVKETTLLAGSEIHTAYTVAGIFARGLEDELRRRAASAGGERE